MGDSDELFARIIAGLEIPSVSGCSGESVATASVHSMAASAAEQTTYTAGAQHHEVHPDDPEYRKIKLELENAGLILKKLVKLTNTLLAAKFQTEADHLMRFRPQGFLLNVQYLYHGTTAPFVQICDEGLDERLSRSGRFGRGIYFSDNPQKCCKYARRHKDEPYLLRCKVIMGDVKEYPAGNEDRKLQKEPLKTVKDGKRVYYDSVKGQPHDHNEYVIYDKRRALIEYVVFYSVPSVSSPANVSDTREAQLVGATASNHNSGISRHGVDVSRSGSSSPVSGSSSPTSGCSTPHSDVEVDDVSPVTYESVKRVNVVRERSHRLPAQSAGSDTKTTSSAAAAATAAVSSASVTSASSATICPKVLSSEIYAAPQLAALRYLLDMKGKLRPDQMEQLTREYHRTYGSLGAVAGGASAAPPSTDLDPVSEVMSKLILEFKEVTQCTDDDVCRTYIELGQMDLNRAIEAYIDAMS